MRSRAHIKGHPIHPSLIPFPFAFLWGAALFDLGYLVSDRTAWTVTASHLTLAGIGAGLLAAVPGIIDYLYAVPPRSSARQRATKHAIGNVVALLIFFTAWWLRADDGTMSTATLALELAGAGLLAYSGLLGGELVVRNMISVNHRYANKGRWQEEDFSTAPGTSVVVAKAKDLGVGHMKLVRVNGRRVAVARTADGVCAFEDRCTHRGGSLAGGVLIGKTVQCLWHGSQFDVRTGRLVCGPAEEGIRTFPIEQRGDDIVLVSPPKS